jgi:phage shock protein C
MTQQNRPQYRTMHRSQTDRKLAGVCGGIAEYLRVDPTLVRLLTVVLAIVSVGTAALAYLVAMVVMPDAPRVAAPVWNYPPDEPR